jgi:hypothetical protein
VRVKKVKRAAARKKAVTHRSRKPTRSSSASAAASSASSASSSPAAGPGPFIFGVACVVCFVAAIALIPTHGSQQAAAAPQSAVSPQLADSSPQQGGSRPAAVGSRASATSARAVKAVKSEPPSAKASEADTVIEPRASAVVEPVKSATVAEPSPEPATRAVSAEHASTAAVETVASVTITGCLEHDDEAFWLSDASGADAPVSRSWRSGFLKKRPSRIELVDAAHALRLTNYVGQRVAATGTLVNREMKTHSLHPVGSSCS